MPASKALKTLLLCTCLVRSALSSGIKDNIICIRVVKKSKINQTQTSTLSI
jgi:hypothetical protein